MRMEQLPYFMGCSAISIFSASCVIHTVSIVIEYAKVFFSSATVLNRDLYLTGMCAELFTIILFSSISYDFFKQALSFYRNEAEQPKSLTAYFFEALNPFN